MEEAGQSTHKLAILSLNAESNRSQRYCTDKRDLHEVGWSCVFMCREGWNLSTPIRINHQNSTFQSRFLPDLWLRHPIASGGKLEAWIEYLRFVYASQFDWGRSQDDGWIEKSAGSPSKQQRGRRKKMRLGPQIGEGSDAHSLQVFLQSMSPS